MHEYPMVPNVFRVASSHSIDSVSVNAAQPRNNMQLIYNKSNSYDQQHQQQQLQLGKHQLTTCAFIEQPHQSLPPLPPQPPQQSPYATLPRNLPRRQYTQQQQQQMHASNVISTISGSIPATGFASLASSYSDLQLNNMQLNNMQPQPQPQHCNNNSNIVQQQQHEQEMHQMQQQPEEFQQQQQQQQLQQQQQQQQQNHVTFEEPAIEREQQQQQPQQEQEQTEENANANEALSPEYSGISNLSNGYLWLLTPVAASISVAIVIAALAGPQWLYTEEKLPNANYNGTANFNALDDGAYITKHTRSSLWIMCTTLQGQDVDAYKCKKIDYFSDEDYEPDPHDSTTAIPYTVTKSSPIFLAAGMSLVISFVIFLIPTCSRQNSLYYFSAGILYIVSGLLMLIGLIAYISILKAEIGSKLRTRTILQPALFKVTYGQSFFLFVSGFIVTELVGVLNIFLYINLQEYTYYSRMTCFSVANIQATLRQRRAALALGQTYRRYEQPVSNASASQDTVELPLNEMHPLPVQRQPQPQPQAQPVVRPSALRTSNLRTQQVHDSFRGPMQSQTLPGGYAGRKYPNVNNAFGGSNMNLFLHNEFDRRAYFEKTVMPKSNLQTRNLAKSLNELCREPALAARSAAAPVPPPPTFADLPQEFPLTRSISHAIDINKSAEQVQRKQQRNMATNTQVLQLEEEEEQTDDRLCGLKRGLRKTTDELFQEFCKRAGKRNKPKNIYYIASEEGEDVLSLPRTDNKDGKRNVDVSKDPNDDKDGDDNGFRQFRAIMDDDHLYVVGDHTHLMVPNRDSICMNAILSPLPQQPMRRLNSNLSLHTPQAEIWPWPSQPRLATEHGQSRTLPRCFLRPTMGSQDSLGSLQSNFSTSQQRFSQIMQQQQLQQRNRFLSTLTLPRGGEEALPKGPVQWPQAIPSSPSYYANTYLRPNTQQLFAPAMPIPLPPMPVPMPVPMPLQMQIPVPVQMPVAVPLQIPVQLSAPVSNNNVVPQSKFQRSFAFDDAQRRISFSNNDALEMDDLGRERRRSEASLYGTIVVPQTQEQYDLINGTAV